VKVAHILYPVEVLGPGKRVGIWLCGCPHRCPGCSNPELWQSLPQQEVSVDTVYSLVAQVHALHAVEGFTITGGEPFIQAAELVELLERLAGINEDIMVYTGYTLEELTCADETDGTLSPEFSRSAQIGTDFSIGEDFNSLRQTLFKRIAVLIDGRYLEERNVGVALRGSDNQRIHVLQPQFEERYANYLATYANSIQNFRTQDGFISVGIHRPGYQAEIGERLLGRGITITKSEVE